MKEKDIQPNKSIEWILKDGSRRLKGSKNYFYKRLKVKYSDSLPLRDLYEHPKLFFPQKPKKPKEKMKQPKGEQSYIQKWKKKKKGEEQDLIHQSELRQKKWEKREEVLQEILRRQKNIKSKS